MQFLGITLEDLNFISKLHAFIRFIDHESAFDIAYTFFHT